MACPQLWFQQQHAHTVRMQMLQDTQAYVVTGNLLMLMTAGKGNSAHVLHIADGCLDRIKENCGGLVVGLLQLGSSVVLYYIDCLIPCLSEQLLLQFN